MKILERFLDRRISAHETVVDLAIRMRIMVSPGTFDPSGELTRAPELMSSREVFYEWFEEFARGSALASTWLSTPVKRELNFVQDYMATLHVHLPSVPSEHFLAVGHFIRQDFIDLSANLERVAFDFFKLDATKLRVGDLAEHHKYIREETGNRLQRTVMIGQWKELQALIQSCATLPGAGN